MGMRDDNRALVQAIIAGGEGYYAEFKTAWSYGPNGKEPRPLKEVARDVGETLVAFANSDGGDLLVGVEDDGAVTGVPYEGDALRYLVNAPKREILDVDLGATVRTVALDGKTVLWFRVEEHAGEPVVDARGRCLWRRGARSEPVPPREIERRRQHVLGDAGYEATPEPRAAVEDLDPLLARWPRPGRPPSRPPLRPPFRLWRHFDDFETLLRYWNLIESRNGVVTLRRAALLLFAREPLRWHANNRLRIRRVHGDDEGFGRRLRTREQEVSGPIAALIPRAIDLLQRELAAERRQETLFSTAQILPEEAISECVVNAVAHRNYAIEGQAIEILLFPDRVEVKSPGRLPEPITVEDLRRERGVHRSRNIIMRVLRDLGWARDQGEGMRRIFGAMRQVELEVPELEEVADTFIVRLSARSIYDELTQAWLAAYGPFGLRPEERKYLVHLRQVGGRSSVDKLARRLGESFDETKKHLVRLEKKGLVWHRPRTRTYRLVESTNVPHEIALRALERAGVEPSRDAVLSRDELKRITRMADERSLSSEIDRWQQAGILRPAAGRRWRLGTSFLEYLRQRQAD